MNPGSYRNKKSCVSGETGEQKKRLATAKTMIQEGKTMIQAGMLLKDNTSATALLRACRAETYVKAEKKSKKRAPRKPRQRKVKMADLAKMNLDNVDMGDDDAAFLARMAAAP